MGNIRNAFRAARFGLAPITWLLVEWDCTGHGEAWFSELLRKYCARQEMRMAERAR